MINSIADNNVGRSSGDPGSVFRPPLNSGTAMPACSASERMAVGKSTPSRRMTKEKTSPPISHTQHFHVCRSWLTVIEGRRSLCQGQVATKFRPWGRNSLVEPTTSTMSTAARTRSFRSKSVERDKIQLRGARQVDLTLGQEAKVMSCDYSPLPTHSTVNASSGITTLPSSLTCLSNQRDTIFQSVHPPPVGGHWYIPGSR